MVQNIYPVAMTRETLERIQKSDVVRKRLAKIMALQCFRNTTLEDLHAGASPSSKTCDFSDVKVVSPYGEIPWDKVSRFNDEEMKALMIDVVNHCYNFLLVLFKDAKGNDIIDILSKEDLMKDWQDPTGL